MNLLRPPGLPYVSRFILLKMEKLAKQGKFIDRAATYSVMMTERCGPLDEMIDDVLHSIANSRPYAEVSLSSLTYLILTEQLKDQPTMNPDGLPNVTADTIQAIRSYRTRGVLGPKIEGAKMDLCNRNPNLGRILAMALPPLSHLEHPTGAGLAAALTYGTLAEQGRRNLDYYRFLFTRVIPSKFKPQVDDGIYIQNGIH